MTTQTNDQLTEWQTNFLSYIKAGYQILYIHSPEELRVELTIVRAISALNEQRLMKGYHTLEVVTWDINAGFKTLNDRLYADKKKPPVLDPAAVLDRIIDGSEAPSAIFVLRDFDDYLAANSIRRKLQSIDSQRLIGNMGEFSRVIVILSSKLNIPDKLKHHISILPFALPDERVINERIDYSVRELSKPMLANLTETLRTDLTQNLTGLTAQEVDNAVCRSLVLSGGISKDMLAYVKDEKAMTFEQGQILTYTPDNRLPNMADIGGYEALFDWISRAKMSFSKAARENKMDIPRGIGLLGAPGSCKSVCAKGIAKLLELPSLSMDFSAIFGSKVGESETRMRETLAQIDAQDGCVLLIDEVDKMLGGADSSSGDSGVTRRVFGNLLTWMAEKKSRTFVVFTMNRMDFLPPELTRAGRLDKLWFVDMPDATVRRKIMEIHFRKRGVAMSDLNISDRGWSTIMQATENFIGSEVETVVIESRRLSFFDGYRTLPTEEEIITAAKDIISLWSREEDKMLKFKKDLTGIATSVAYPSISTIVKRRTNNRQIEA